MRRHLPQARDCLFAQAIAQILLGGVAAQVFEGEYRQHDARRFCINFCRQRNDSGLKAISPAEDGVYIFRVSGVISEGPANFSDSGVDAVLGVEVKALSPKLVDNFFPVNYPSISPHQQDE